MVRIKLLGVAATGIALLALVAIFGGIASAQGTAQPATPHPVRVSGSVSAIAPNSLVLKTPRGDVTVNVSAGTWVVVEKNGQAAEGVLADIQTGKVAVVSGTSTPNANVVDARIITQGRPLDRAAARRAGRVYGERVERIAKHVAAGTITATNGNTITLKGARVPEIIVQTTANTVLLNNGFVDLGAFHVGDKVQVLGAPVGNAGAQTPPTTPGTNGSVPASRTINAWGLRIDTPSTRLVAARVESVNGNAVSIKTYKNRSGLMLTVNGSTGYKSLTVANGTPTLSNVTATDLKAGSIALMEIGTGPDGKAQTAMAVILLPNLGQR
ncbi:MAG: hypothetical protein ABI670_00215 [Chloroflexota bacterium]